MKVPRMTAGDGAGAVAHIKFFAARTCCGMQSGRTNTPMRQHERRRAVLCAAATRSHRGIVHAEAHVCCLMHSFQPAR
jgi:hypothetical protein